MLVVSHFMRKIVVIHGEVCETSDGTVLGLGREAEHDVGEIILVVVMPDDGGREVKQCGILAVDHVQLCEREPQVTVLDCELVREHALGSELIRIGLTESGIDVLVICHEVLECHAHEVVPEIPAVLHGNVDLHRGVVKERL